GEKRFFSNNLNFIELNGKKHLLAVFYDITERKLAEEALRESEGKYSSLFNAMGEGFGLYEVVYGEDGGPCDFRFVDVNPAYLRGLGVSRDQLIGRTMLEINPSTERYWLDFFCKVAKTGEPGRLEDYTGYSDRWIDIYAFQSGKGRVAFLLSDISERKRAEVVLRESERAHAFQSAVLESVRDPVWATDPDFRIVYWNDAAAATFGWTADEVRGRHTGKLFRTVIPGSTRDDAVAQLLQTGDFRGEVVCHCKDGRQIFAEISSRVVRGPDGEAVRIVNTARDITERKRVEGALCESEARLRAVIDGAPLAIALTGPSGEILLRNPRFDQLWGRPAHVTTARTYSEVYEGYHLDGRRIESEEWPGARAVLKGEIIENEVYEIVQADGRRITCWFGSVPIRNASEEIVGALVVFRDITKERRTEEALQDAKTQAELYLDLMGHDINNMHQIAIGYLEMAQGILPDGGQSEFVDKPLEVLHRSAQLIQNVRKLQRLHEGLIQTQDVDVCQILTNVRREFGSIPRKTITLNLNGCEDCFVRANELLYDVFANLAGNAVKHTRDGADIYIDLDIIKDDSGRYCRVCVEDDGPGILDDYKDIIFNRGIKGISRETGMGLGLYLVKSLVNSYDGRVWVEDRIAGDHSKGARFVVVLPTVKD
ncbi:MAG TPA: PAS domain-containing sensor histidine kinase, partial [Methanocella sp.]|nr:PAS domain-containing sensor histidine kinase [Methanocella sp.]